MWSRNSNKKRAGVLTMAEGTSALLDARELQRQLKLANDTEDVLEVVRSWGESFDAIHWTTALHRVAFTATGSHRLQRDKRFQSLLAAQHKVLTEMQTTTDHLAITR
eukprot:CAMPEP_0178445180 /NCGR_PEP_ID=MMETSP0689_2-20121128/39997_1 /TAXON_ID=160604 /ORGANISM="Amphidinium massartii, Strain CS-259" /LENGTH=106 /DNA_ID=CAMNT_0020069649 /DNA_START=42 /DNA_END=360 /DNA_ORIENTATION=+